jgi:uncharacterized membrane protein
VRAKAQVFRSPVLAWRLHALDGHATTHTQTPHAPEAPMPLSATLDRVQKLVTRLRTDGQLNRGLAWLSIGVGGAQLVAPGRWAWMVGLPDSQRSRTIIRTRGLRELVSGAAMLNSDRPELAWLRVAGNVIDLGLLASSWSSRDVSGGRLAGAIASTLGMVVVDGLAAAARASNLASVEVSGTIAINKEPGEVYRFWKQPANLPRFMAHLESASAIDDRHVRWTSRGLDGQSEQWEVEIVEDEPEQLIVWRLHRDDAVACAGAASFTRGPGGRGTAVHVALHHRGSSGDLGAAVARLFGELPKQELTNDLRRLKQILETGEVVHSDASIHHGLHPAQPSQAPLPNASPERGEPAPTTPPPGLFGQEVH